MSVHLAELVGLAVDGGLEVLGGGADSAVGAEFREGVDGLGLGGGAEELRYALESVFFSLLGEHEVLAVGLGLPGECGCEIIFR